MHYQNVYIFIVIYFYWWINYNKITFCGKYIDIEKLAVIKVGIEKLKWLQL